MTTKKCSIVTPLHACSLKFKIQPYQIFPKQTKKGSAFSLKEEHLSFMFSTTNNYTMHLCILWDKVRYKINNYIVVYRLLKSYRAGVEKCTSYKINDLQHSFPKLMRHSSFRTSFEEFKGSLLAEPVRNFISTLKSTTLEITKVTKTLKS